MTAAADELQDRIGADRYRIEEELGRGGMGIVFSAYDTARNHRVALKTLNHVEASSLYQFKREFRALSDIAHPNLIALYELHAIGGQWFFTMELVEGQDFLTYVRGGQPGAPSGPGVRSSWTPTAHAGPTEEDLPDDTVTHHPISSASSDPRTQPELSGEIVARRSDGSVKPSARLDRLRPVLRQVSEALLALHENGYLHRDIKPSNVLVTAEGKALVLDFGVITEMVGPQAQFDQEFLVGTPAYMAPEQGEPAGHPGAPADWYGLGVMLYEALTGHKPFRGAPEVLLQAKQQYEPVRPDELVPDLPEDLTELCVDLLRRDPDARPTGTQVLHRLGSRPAHLAANEPGLPDPVAHTLLVGREHQLQILREAWQRVLRGTGQAVLVGGRSGMGKSVLVEHFLSNELRGSGAVVLLGRCYERESVPYKALDSLIDSLCQELLRLPNHELASLLPADVVSLARAFPVLWQLRPVIEAGEEMSQRRREEQRGDLQRRAFAALRELLANLAGRSPVVLFVDDLQWGDGDSAPLLSEIIGLGKLPLLFIASYRSEEVQRSPLLQTLFAALGTEWPEHVHEALVEELSEADTQRLAETLLDKEGGDASLAPPIAREAQGNPYFVHELVRHVLTTAEASIESTSVESVILKRAEHLSEDAQRLLEVVAVAGWRITHHAAHAAAELPSEQQRAFLELRAEHFVRTSGVRQQDTVEPYHDRVREALLTTLSWERARAIHLRIAETLDAEPRGGVEHIYALAHHFFHAAPSGQLKHVFDLNWRAARTASESYAYDQAYHYMDQARQIATQATIPTDADFEQQFAELAARAGRVDYASQSYQRALELSEQPQQRAELRLGQSKLALGQLDTASSHQAALDALVEMGHRPPRSGAAALLGSLPTFRRGLRRARAGTAVGMASQVRAEKRTLSQIHNQIALTAYFRMDRLFMLQMILRQLEPLSSLGPCREFVEWHALASVVAAVRNKEDLSQRLGTRGLEMARELRDPVSVARCLQYHGHSLHMLGRTVEAEKQLKSVLDEYGHLLENLDFLTAAADLAWNTLMRGLPLDGWHYIQRGLQRAALARGGQSRLTQGHTYRCYAGPLLAMLGRPAEGEKHLNAFKDVIDDTPDDRWRWGQYLAHRILFLVESERLDDELDRAIESHTAMGLKPGPLPLQLKHVYVAIARARLTQYEHASKTDRAARRATYLQARKDLERAAGHPTLRSYAHVLDATFARLQGKLRNAERALEQASSLADTTDNPRVRFEVTRERARIAEREDEPERAASYRKEASELAMRHGWAGPALQVAGMSGPGALRSSTPPPP